LLRRIRFDPTGGELKIKDLSKDQLMKLAQETYDKEQWSPECFFPWPLPAAFGY
jgi:hypothetical protein